MSETFTAMMIEDVDGKPRAGFREITKADLPDNDVLVEVGYSSLNYKDGLSISGKGRIARRLPMVAGIDIAGTVVESRSPWPVSARLSPSRDRTACGRSGSAWRWRRSASCCS